MIRQNENENNYELVWKKIFYRGPGDFLSCKFKLDYDKTELYLMSMNDKDVTKYF